MAYDSHKNFAISKVAGAPSPATTGTTLAVTTGDGTKFPTPPFNAVVWPANTQPTTTNAEIVRVTGISTDTFTITRIQESTSARTIVVGDQIAAAITAKTLTDLESNKLELSGGTMTGLLQFSGTDHAGLKLNSLTTTQRDALTAANGDLIYNSSLSLPQIYQGGAWGSIGKSIATKIVAPAGIPADYNTDGTADDVEIQAALTAVSSAGGGIVHLRAGTYDMTTTVTIPSNIILQGEGYKTQIKANANMSGIISMFQNSDISSGNTNIVVRDLSIDGNQANRTGKVIQDTNGHNLMLRKCTFSKISNVQSFNGIISNLAIGRESSNCIIEDSVAYNSWDHNILLLGNSAGSLTCNQNIVRNNISYGAGQGAGQGVGIEIAQLCSQNTITGNISYSNLEGGIHLFYQSTYNTVVGNVCISNGQIGIALVDQSDYNTISGNVIYNSGASGIEATIFQLAYGGKYCVIANNIIKGCSKNGIRGNTSQDLSNSTITGNHIEGNGAGGAGNDQNGIYCITPVSISFTNNRIISSNLAGIRLDNAARCVINNNYVASNLSRGIYLETSSNLNFTTDCQISNNLIESNVGAGIILAKNASRCTLSGNTIKSQSSGNPGIDVRGISHSIITNNNCISNSSYGIRLLNDANAVASTYNTVSSNTCYLNTTAGISEEGAADYNIFTGNNCNGNTASNFTAVGTHDEIGFNIIT